MSKIKLLLECLLVLFVLAGDLLFDTHPCVAESGFDIKYVRRLPEGVPAVQQHARSIPIIGQADVVVVGGGVAGVSAAITAATGGASVVLIEQRNHFGYELAGPQACTDVAHRPAPAYTAAEAICRKLAQQGAYRQKIWHDHALKRSLASFVAEEPNLRPFLYTMPAGVVMDGDTVRGVVMVNRAGRQIILGKVVIDATPDAHIAAAAGARFSRPITGEKTARRFVSVDKKALLEPGKQKVPAELGLVDDTVIIHDVGRPVVEFAVRTTIGENVALDLSQAQALTREKAAAVVDYLGKTQSAFRDGKIDPEHRLRDGFRVSGEMLVDEGPVVDCDVRLTPEDVSALKFSNPACFRVKGIERLVVAGRIVSPAIEMSRMQELLICGEQAGRTALKLSTNVVSRLVPDLKPIPTNGVPTGLRVCELLHGPQCGEAYPVIYEAATELPVVEHVDVLVIGTGTSGAPAAIAAARQGASVVAVEILPNLGGTGSNRVTKYYWGVTWRSGLTQDIDADSGVYFRAREKYSLSGEEKKLALQRLAAEAGVKVYYETLGVGAVVDGNRVVGAVIENTSGRQVILANTVIDGTGHGDIAVAAGASFTKGRARDGLMHEVAGNGLRDPTNVEDITRFALKRPPSRLSLSVRESRHVTGDHVVTFEETIRSRTFPDLVCKWRSNYDTHFPSSANQSDLAQDWVAIMGLWRKPLVGRIPYRALLPKGLDGILVVAKSHSTDHDTKIGARMNRDLQHLGEAAGTAAAMAARMQTTARGVPIGQLQQQLIELGVLREEDLNEKPGMLGFDSAEAVKLLGTDKAVGAMADLYMAGPRVVDAVKLLLKADDVDQRLDVALVLGMLGDRSAIPVLLECLDQKNCRTHVFTLTGCSSRRSVPAYYSAIILLGRFQVKQAVPSIVETLENPDECPPDLASFAIVALERIGDPSVVAAIKPYLAMGESTPMDNENESFERKWGVRTNAARALAALGDRSGVPVLMSLLDADQSLLRDYAQRLLEDITGNHLGVDRRRRQQPGTPRGTP